jgi:hypothetical protein
VYASSFAASITDEAAAPSFEEGPLIAHEASMELITQRTKKGRTLIFIENHSAVQV